MDAEMPAPDFVIRLLDVAVDRIALATALGVDVDRYEPSRGSLLSYAQVSMDGEFQWSSIADFLEKVGPRIRELIHQRMVGSAIMDVAIHFPSDKIAVSSKMPARIALLIGQNLIDLETSIYSTSSDR